MFTSITHETLSCHAKWHHVNLFSEALEAMIYRGAKRANCGNFQWEKTLMGSKWKMENVLRGNSFAQIQERKFLIAFRIAICSIYAQSWLGCAWSALKMKTSTANSNKYFHDKFLPWCILWRNQIKRNSPTRRTFSRQLMNFQLHKQFPGKFFTIFPSFLH